MLKIVLSNRFKKDIKVAKKRKLNLNELRLVINKLANQEQLEEKYKDHPLSGDFKDFRENMDAEKCYLQGRFDAVPYINSSISIIKNLLGE